MDSFELIHYLKGVSDYIEYSFYNDSTEIMGAIAKNGFESVFNVLSMTEVGKGVYACITTWEINEHRSFKKNVTIDMSGEMVFITETMGEVESASKNEGALLDMDLEKEYGEVLKMMRKRHLNHIEKAIFIKVIKAFFE